ncbi:hypothetical protein BDY21DRAFT_353224 [Lineolata rhizophorae]|uniref:Protein kinase domain-containing protein n=1 Tax=Lineolata rhizophorae TaxID=578093 RepID=A0A6A6NQX8_9PEZI|nr:hypothetical protein BDY21DRAFT_353224 [Lineolata rhizophorae]
MLHGIPVAFCNDMCHCDVKPENILCWDSTDGYAFQLADFGLANHRLLAVTKCGTVTDIYPKLSFLPAQAKTYAEFLRAIRAAVLLVPKLAYVHGAGDPRLPRFDRLAARGLFRRPRP